jgi:hypothetical protein
MSASGGPHEDELRGAGFRKRGRELPPASVILLVVRCGCADTSSAVVAIPRRDVGQDAAESVTARVAENVGCLAADRARVRDCIVAADRHIDLVRDRVSRYRMRADGGYSFQVRARRRSGIYNAVSYLRNVEFVIINYGNILIFGNVLGHVVRRFVLLSNVKIIEK